MPVDAFGCLLTPLDACKTGRIRRCLHRLVLPCGYAANCPVLHGWSRCKTLFSGKDTVPNVEVMFDQQVLHGCDRRNEVTGTLQIRRGALDVALGRAPVLGSKTIKIMRNRLCHAVPIPVPLKSSFPCLLRMHSSLLKHLLNNAP